MPSMQSSLWYAFDYFVTLAEIFAEFCRKFTTDPDLKAIGGANEKKMLSYLKKVIGYVKSHMAKFRIAEPAFYYVSGLYLLFKNDRAGSKAMFEKAVVTGKSLQVRASESRSDECANTFICNVPVTNFDVALRSLQVLALVAKSYYCLGTNYWDSSRTGRFKFKNSAVGGSAYAVISPDSERSLSGRAHAHYLHRAFVFARTCDMAELQKDSKRAIDECIDSDYLNFYDETSHTVDVLGVGGAGRSDFRAEEDDDEGVNNSSSDRDTGKWIKERRMSEAPGGGA